MAGNYSLVTSMTVKVGYTSRRIKCGRTLGSDVKKRVSFPPPFAAELLRYLMFHV